MLTRKDAKILLLFFLLPAFAFFFPFLGGKVHFAGDILYSFHPWLTYAAQELQAGHMPLWNPYTSCGEPFLANPQTLVFFPLAILFWVFPFAAAWPLFLVVTQGLLFSGVYLLARTWDRSAPRAAALLCALAVTWGGFTVVHWEFASAAATLSILPFFLLLSLTGRWRLMVPATALLFLGGYSQFAVYGLLWVALLSAWKFAKSRVFQKTWDLNLVLGCAAALVCGLLIALPQVLPTQEAVRNSLRAAMAGPEARSHLLNPVFIIKFLIPAIFDKVALPFSQTVFDPSHWPIQRNWLTTFFIGTAPFLLALSALPALRKPKNIFLLITTVVFAMLAMGWDPVFSILRHTVPGMRYMTHFSNAMLMVVISMALFSMEGVRGMEARPRWIWFAWGTAAGLSFPLILSPSIRVWTIGRLLGPTALTAARHDWIILNAAISCASLAFLAICFLSRRGLRLPLIILFTLTELWIFGHDIHPFAQAGFFHKKVYLTNTIAGSDYRLSIDPEVLKNPALMDGENIEEGYQSVRQILRPNIHLPFHIHHTWGYEVFPLRAFSEFRRTLVLTRGESPQLSFLASRRVLSSRPLPRPFTAAAQRPNALLYAREDALPRVAWVAQAKVIGDSRERLDYLAGDWKPEKEVVFEKGPTTPEFGEAKALTEINIDWEERPGELIARGATDRPGWLVYSGPLYPGWEAYANGEKVELRRGNHAFMAVKVPNGNWEVVLLYRPVWLPISILISVGVLAVLALMSSVFLRRPTDRAVPIKSI